MKIHILKNGACFVPMSDEDAEKLYRLDENTAYVASISVLNARTIQQNRAMHLWFTMIADTLNINGNQLQSPITGNRIDWSGELVKELIFKRTMELYVPAVRSSSNLTKRELNDLIEIISAAFAKKGIELPEFPNKNI